MSAAFTRSLRALEADNPRRHLWWVGGGCLLLGGWAAWFLGASVPVRLTSRQARVEVVRAAHRIDAPAEGRVVSTAVALGREVQAGEVLLELEAEAQRQELAQQRAQLDALAPRVDQLKRSLAEERRALRSWSASSQASLRQARAQQREAEAKASLAEQQLARARALRAEGVMSEEAADMATAGATAAREAAAAAKAAAHRRQAENAVEDGDRRAAVEALAAELARVDGELAAAKASAERLRAEIERRIVRAPIAGRVAEDAGLRPGSAVEIGEPIAAIVPDGALRVVARFGAEGIGRLAVGQPARARLDAYPWSQYGSIPARVTAVGSEPRDGGVGVELEVLGAREGGPPVQHGLTGSVEVERTSPASLVLRAAGRMLSRRAG